MSPLEEEIAAELDRIRNREEIIPFLDQWLPAAEATFKPLPDEMRAIIQSSPDYVSMLPGSPSTWLQLETDGASAELVVYRAQNGSYHVLAADLA